MKRIVCLALLFTFIITAAFASDFPVTVVDTAGRNVTIAAVPQRVVSGYYISTSAIIALGQKDRIVGLEAKADKREIYSLSAKELVSYPSVGTAKQLDMETLLNLKPEFVVLPMAQRQAADILTQMGIPAIVVNPESYDQFLEMIRLLGKILDADSDLLLSFYTEKENKLSSLLAGCEKPSVYLGGNSDFLRTAGSSMYQDTMLRFAGSINVAEDIMDASWVDISYEQLIAWNPDVILLAADASYTVEDVLADELLRDVGAVKNGKVYALPSSPEAWDSPVPGTIVGSLWLASRLHPEVYSEEEFIKDANEFYETFYGFTLY